MSKEKKATTPKPRRRGLRLAIIGAALAVTGLALSPISPLSPVHDADAASTMAAPNFEVPFPCGQSWSGQTRTNHSPANAIDFNRTNDSGDPVAASAAGTVSVVRDKGNTSYGKYVVINHASGYQTLYAHLSKWSVSVGQKVSLGQTIGYVGNTGGSTGAHLHYEQRSGGSAVKIRFDGGQAYYWGTKTYKSSNKCSGGGGNPYTAAQVCGSGYKVIDSAALKSGGKTYGTVYLAYNASNKYNCVVTLKATSLGKKTAVKSYLEPKGKSRTTDSGNYSYYAGPVKKSAPSCVKWGGSAGPASYNSPSEHCG